MISYARRAVQTTVSLAWTGLGNDHGALSREKAADWETRLSPKSMYGKPVRLSLAATVVLRYCAATWVDIAG